MLVKAAGPVPNFKRLVNKGHARLVFYGAALPAIRSWLQGHVTTKVAYEGTVHIYEGRYEKTKHGSSEMYDSMSVRHLGWGKGTLGTPGLSGGTKLALKATGTLQTRYFIALVHDSVLNGRNAETAKPHIMHHQKMCRYRHTWSMGNAGTKGGLNFSNIRS